MVVNKNSHELLIFDYAPNLKIVGAFHALNAQDKQDLERLITESDFVALESDEHRTLNNNKVTIVLSIPYSPTHWDEKSQRMITNIFDLAYLSIFSYMNQYYITSLNAGGNQRRNTEEYESDFCHDVARQKNKPVYLVDTPAYTTLEKLASLNPLQKALHLLTLLFDRENPPAVRRILADEREDYMLRQIERHERRKIKNLRRKGLLVVGYSHAANYYGNAGLAKLPEKTFK